MTLFLRNTIILGVLMLSTCLLSIVLTPTVSDKVVQFDLKTLVPRQFGDWQEEEQVPQAIVNPQTKELLDSLYSQILSRTYINRDGRRIMLSLAYGTDQLHDTRIHRPEVCYPAQGFRLGDKWNDVVSVGSVTFPVMRIVAQLGSRHESITYWIRVGDSLVRGAVEQSFARIGHGFTGHIPDGILFRVSEINPDTRSSISLQDQFIRALLLSLSLDHRKILLGSIGSKIESGAND